MANVHLLLGSNLGERQQLLQQARELIQTRVGHIVWATRLMPTKACDYHSANDYLNQIVVCRTTLQPLNLLDSTQQIERELGRVRPTHTRYADRTIDIDILYYDDLVVNCHRLTIPHPQIQSRDFVLELLAELPAN